MDKRKESLIAGRDIPFKVGIISDVHGNHYALKKAIKILKSLGIKKYIFLGDAIGYIPSLEALNVIFQNSDDFLCIKGNHEDMFLNKKIPAKKNEFYLLDIIKSKISSDGLNYISSWKDSITIQHKGMKFLFIHGSPDDYTNGYIYPDSKLNHFKMECDVVFMGNSHWAFDRSLNSKRFINPGSCGLPRDNGRYGSVGVFDFLTLEYSPIRFDIFKFYSRLIKEHPEIHPATARLRDRENIRVSGEILA